MDKLADYYDEEVEMSVQSLMAAMEPYDHHCTGSRGQWTDRCMYDAYDADVHST